MWKIRDRKCFATSSPSKRELPVYSTVRPSGVNKKVIALSRPIKRQMTVYSTSRSRGANDNAKPFRKQNKKQKQKSKSK